MTKKEIATLSFKVLSLYAFIEVIDKLSSLLYYMSHYDLYEGGIFNFMLVASPLIPMILLLLCGVLFWFKLLFWLL